MFKSYKYRIYPNRQQKELIQKTFGCCRFVYNQTLAYKKELYETEKKCVGRFDCNNYVSQVLNKKYEWLKEVDSCALRSAIRDMDSAYQKFFKEHKGYPKFKSKKNNKQSYTTNFVQGNIKVSFVNNKIQLPKLKWIKAKIHREFIGTIKSATISQLPSGKYYVSILIETEHKPIQASSGTIGIDLGIKHLLITSNGEKINNIHTTKKYADKLAKEQRKLSHKINGSKNWDKQRVKVAKIYEKIHNTRIDNLHKISRKLISENQVIVSENLAVSDMMKNHNFAKAIQDCGWYELTRQLDYKANWNDRQYIKIDRFIPSSQICSCCGYVNVDTKNLSMREWFCPQCGVTHDRDINAAINVLNEGLKLMQRTM